MGVGEDPGPCVGGDGIPVEPRLAADVDDDSGAAVVADERPRCPSPSANPTLVHNASVAVATDGAIGKLDRSARHDTHACFVVSVHLVALHQRVRTGAVHLDAHGIARDQIRHPMPATARAYEDAHAGLVTTHGIRLDEESGRAARALDAGSQVGLNLVAA